MPRPDEEFVTSIVEQAVEQVLAEDEVLFQRGVAEWSVAHRLAVYLEVFSDRFPGWSVDCEFNRQPFDEESDDLSPDQTKKVGGETKRPDIIVHKRADPDANVESDNLLAIELKVNEEEDGDIADIEDIRAEKEYDCGVFIDFYGGPNTLQEWTPEELKWRPERLNR